MEFSMIPVFQYFLGIQWKMWNFPAFHEIPIFSLEILEYWDFPVFQQRNVQIFQYYLWKYWNIGILQDFSISIFPLEIFIGIYNIFSGNIGIQEGFQYSNILIFPLEVLTFSSIPIHHIGIFQDCNIPIFSISSGAIGILKFSRIPVF